MKLLVKCSIGVPADGLKELVIRNPTATLSNVRAAIAINFRLPVHSFRMVHCTADLSDEKQLLNASGVKDEDVITVISKRDREEDNAEADAEARRTSADLPKSKESPTAENKEKDTDKDESTAAKETENEDDEDEDEDEGEGGAEEGSAELLSHLLATVPNLVEMRRQFLENPAEIMRQIQQRDPHLFDLIAANHQEFLGLVNNEALIETLQLEQELVDEEEEYYDEENEIDEEGEEALQRVLLQYLSDGFPGSGDADADGETPVSETQRYLEREPSTEDETKIEQLMQLGFTRDQCKVAYFKANKSVERAANLLFEDPPQL